jgi:hypothetical protein
LYSGEKRSGDRIGQNPETGEILIVGRNIYAVTQRKDPLLICRVDGAGRVRGAVFLI